MLNQIFITEPGVVFALVRENKILMQQRDGNCKRFPFMWCIPGGGCNKGESYEYALLREIKEEYNLDLELSQCKHVMDYSDGDDPLRVYVCKINPDQEPKLREGMAMQWMTLDEIEKLELGFHQQGIIPFFKTTVT